MLSLKVYIFWKVPSFFGSMPTLACITFLQKRLWKSRCYMWKICIMFFQPILQLSRTSSCSPLSLRILYF